MLFRAKRIDKSRSQGQPTLPASVGKMAGWAADVTRGGREGKGVELRPGWNNDFLVHHP